ncbi:glycoside hydrolase family 3 C-terminal domain-containing protein [Mesorhizobium sp. MSK_1335]|uniref:Glycoside hydrolase family 3 C-terminal domain-containing protein n=1 Tax=Mesorhizobium montanum TaxID=3072323 RepID=A0ABU4ZE65_9HYPH|nr:glycoside hydrolase family 3 C-terminal domain-containing protein [Mesorhizobium sp. MSK_1335]MDX8523620.1 glycoside hydrolase family 3 C-terminal domain-containing protein [Mesorhizobium sp. MSK_1335]
MTNEKFIAGDFAALVAEMTDEEKVSLLAGHHMWKTQEIDRLGIPHIVMTDGTYGVRYSIPQIDGDEAGGVDFAAFLSVVNQRADHVQTAWGQMKPATCFPNGTSLACSWDVDLAHQLGEALARECQEFGVHLLLGPGINIRRTPLGGRSYEYYSEDPVLTGDFAAGVIKGLQENGVGASLKHLACNNSEIERTTMDSVVEERALREIYLKGFERAIRQSEPWTVMSSYNRLNGVQAAQNAWLLTKVLRDEWGYGGLVVSDWHGVKDRPASLIAGNDLDMPESETRKADLLAAIEADNVDRALVDRACERVLDLVSKAKRGEDRTMTFDRAEHHALARRLAAESMVLLKNDVGLLPISKASVRRIAIVGEGAAAPVIQGSGCATTIPTSKDVPVEEIRKLAGSEIKIDVFQATSEIASEREALIIEAEQGVAGADIVLVFVNTENGYDGEGSDRRSLGLAPGHDALVERLACANSNIVAVISSPDAVVMPWIGDVPAVIEMFFSGQATGGAVADLLFGRVNPSGKLTTTFPKRMEDMPTHLTYPGENGRHVYSEGIFAGYRWYDARGIEPLFPFGFGLSYTEFAYSNLALDRTILRSGEKVAVSFAVTNIGKVAGKEICQVYARYGQPRLKRPVRELKGFAKLELNPGESRVVTLQIAAEDLCVYDTALQAWTLDNDGITIEVASSSRDIHLKAELHTVSDAVHRRIEWDTQPVFVLENPVARSKFNRFLQKQLDISSEDAERMLEHCANSFVGIFTTFDRRFRHTFPKADVEALLAEINQESVRQERRAA